MRSVHVAAAALLSLAAAAPAAHAATAGPEQSRGLFLTVSGSENTWVRGVRLNCAPQPSGHHPHAAEACEALDAVDGDLDALPVEQQICTKEYDPVTVAAIGTYRGKAIAWHKTFGNACELDASTGYVFRF
ncbi:SSI family serine proteinase inhibitor [Streptomyces endophyticus]|uniref:Subtilase-type protease inhibitor n=1 Tax=Streptomyces endophyticus TaxID=714166 RepID=A0ABU6FCR3_9ACTN|nr:SSI family serine proteinase inhibitor [Streptomyces endophyticus]MEB8341160.1 subtilase-type protease inhibitor [Streptomyces endophyticus]